MARPIKDGADYFPFDVDFFSDRKIKALRARFGADGIALYLYILCEVYRDKGYYLEVDEDFQDNAAADLGVSYEKIGLMLDFLLKKSLLESTLFSRDKVLTSHGIQKRYQEMIKSRAQKKGVTVDPRLWLLNEAETQSFIKVSHFTGYSENNQGFSQINPGKSEINDTKKRKVKERKEKEENAPGEPAVFILIPLKDGTDYAVSESQVEDWQALYPAVDVEQELRNMRGWTQSNPNKRKTRRGAESFITGWLNRRQEKSSGQDKPKTAEEIYGGVFQ